MAAQVPGHGPDVAHVGGIYVPLLTPLEGEERVDVRSLRRLLDHVIDAGVHGIWLLGTTGEFAGLRAAERERAVATAIGHVDGRVPVIVNVGDGGTRLALGHARVAVANGARLLALTPPHYYPHSMDEMAVHYRAVKDACPDTALFVYNIPQTVKVRMTVEATLSLAVEGVVSGIKDSQNDFTALRRLATAARENGLEPAFRIFAGTRSLIDAAFVIGAHGAIPAVANIAPQACVCAYECAVAGDFATAAKAQELAIAYDELAELVKAGSANAATIGAMKQLLRARGVIADATMTAPLRPLSAEDVQLLLSRAEALE